MDEPFASLDVDAATAMRGLLGDLLKARPTRLILVTHDAAEALQLADRIIKLEGSPAVIADQSAVKN
jgi:ABC-type nitrate/sulfonate/bicarbonate transport system ATPase subunit